MTYHYRIYTFQNGLGETVFRAKRGSRLFHQWFQGWVSVGVTDAAHAQKFAYSEWLESRWASREAVMAAIEEDARKQNQGRLYRMGNTLRLVIVEDESVEII
jgi:hypothetical protein